MAADIAAIAVRGLWIKHTYPGSLALPEREPAPDNRWQRGDVIDALYLAEDEETAWAEWHRHLAERMIPPLAQMPRELWKWEVDVEVTACWSTPAPRRRRACPCCQPAGEVQLCAHQVHWQ